MNPTIQHMRQLVLAGFSFFGDPFHSHAGWTETNEIGRVWSRLSHYLGWSGCPYPPPPVSYEILLETRETPQTGEFEVFVGFEVQDVHAVPLELSIKVLPETDYAVFTLRGEAIRMSEPLVDTWLKTADYKRAFPFIMQRYDARFKGLDHLEDSEMDLLIPVTRTS